MLLLACLFGLNGFKKGVDMKMFRMMAAALSAVCAVAQGAEDAAVGAVGAEVAGGDASVSAAAPGAARLSPPDQLVLRAYEWVKVPELPELRGRKGLRMRYVGLLSDGETAEVGSADVYLVAEYGRGDEARMERMRCRYVILEAYRGHSCKMHLHDLDGDGVPELLVEYLSLTDMPRLSIYAFKARDAELGFGKWTSGLQPLVRKSSKRLVALHDGGVLELQDAWCADMRTPIPAPRRYVWREGQLEPLEGEK